MTLELSLLPHDVAPVVLSPPLAGHVHHFGPELARPGTWEITVRERISDRDQPAVTIPVVVTE